MSQDLLARLYRAFDPFRPLPAGDPAWVDCREVRGDSDVLIDLGRKITLSQDQPTCLLYSGLRGVGKSTELLRLQADLQRQGYCVVYFAADQDIDPEDAQYTDILLASTRHVVEQLGILRPSENPLLKWLGDRWGQLRDLVQTEVEFEELQFETQLSQFARLTANVRAVPSLRQEIRRRVDPYTVSLLDALNEYIQKARPEACAGVVIMADNLDRIVPVIKGEKTNHEEIYLDRAEQLKGLKCHVIYTVPISLVYSRAGTLLEDLYRKPEVLPMIMTHREDDSVYPAGLEAIKAVVAQRIQQVDPRWARDPERLIFAEKEVLERICLMSGGHLQILMKLIQVSLVRSPRLPIEANSVQRALTEIRDTYRRIIQSDQWLLLAEVARTKRCPHDQVFQVFTDLLVHRCILEYSYLDEMGEHITWHDIHPLIRGIPEFKALLQRDDTARSSATRSSTVKPHTAQPGLSEPGIYRYRLLKGGSRQDRERFKQAMQQVKYKNPNWILEPDQPRSDEEEAFILIYNDQNYLRNEAAYLVTRSLSDVLLGDKR